MMDDVSREINPAIRADELYHAFKLARKHFADIPANVILAGLELCQKNAGLFVSGNLLFAFLRYDPRQLLYTMQIFDIEELAKYDLSDGPVVHVCAFVAPRDGYRAFRNFIDALNPFAVSAHRLQKRTGERIFTMKRHVRVK
jgi:hypothetical protein